MRPGRSSRPRTKTRPSHADAVTGFVTTVDRGRYTCLVGEQVVTAMRARELQRRSIVVGDRVDLVGDTSGGDGSLARIVRILPRRSVLRRSADDTDPTERVVVAGADQLLIVVAAADPEPRTGFIDRCLVAAYSGHLTPMLLVTKSDLREPAPLLAHYADLDLPVLVSGRAEADQSGTGGSGAGRGDGTGFDVPGRVAGEGGGVTTGTTATGDDDAPLDDEGVAAVRAALTGHVTALIGHSGVGKSTLVNALVPDADRATGSVTGVGKGRHTSSSALALPLPGGGWIIDTPGVRSFGLAHITVDDVLAAFSDLADAAAECQPNCSHASADIGCALDDFVAGGGASPGRLESFRRLLASRSSAGEDADAGNG